MSLSDPEYLNDPEYVRSQYASEEGLAARASMYGNTTGPFAGDIAFAAVSEVGPRRVLEVGCGTGWFAARVQHSLGAEVDAVDQSERMVELARSEGVNARVADVQQLPFPDAEFDCVAANWMLYHVADLDQGLREIARVLKTGARLVAVTNGDEHLVEVWQLIGAEEQRAARHFSFSAENGQTSLERHFRSVEIRDSSGTVEVQGRQAVIAYLASTETWQPLVDRLPDDLGDEPFTARRSTVVFVATK